MRREGGNEGDKAQLLLLLLLCREKMVAHYQDLYRAAEQRRLLAEWQVRRLNLSAQRQEFLREEREEWRREMVAGRTQQHGGDREEGGEGEAGGGGGGEGGGVAVRVWQEEREEEEEEETGDKGLVFGCGWTSVGVKEEEGGLENSEHDEAEGGGGGGGGGEEEERRTGRTWMEGGIEQAQVGRRTWVASLIEPTCKPTQIQDVEEEEEEEGEKEEGEEGEGEGDNEEEIKVETGEEEDKDDEKKEKNVKPPSLLAALQTPPPHCGREEVPLLPRRKLVPGSAIHQSTVQDVLGSATNDITHKSTRGKPPPSTVQDIMYGSHQTHPLQDQLFTDHSPGELHLSHTQTGLGMRRCLLLHSPARA